MVQFKQMITSALAGVSTFTFKGTLLNSGENGVENAPGYYESMRPGTVCTNGWSKFDLEKPQNGSNQVYEITWSKTREYGDGVQGYTSPFVGGEIYLENCSSPCHAVYHTSASEHPDLNENSAVRAFLPNGELLWEYSAAKTAEGFFASPTTAGSSNNVLAGDLFGTLHVIQKTTGEAINVFNLGGEIRGPAVVNKYGNIYAVSSGFGAKGSTYQSVPTILNMIQSAECTSCTIYRREVCHSPRGDGKDWSTSSISPLLVEDGNLIVVRCDNGVYEAYDRSSSLQSQWNYTGISGGLVFYPVAAHTPKGGFILQALNQKLVKISTVDGTEEWVLDDLNVEQIILDTADTAYLILSNSTLVHFDVTNQAVLKSSHLPSLDRVYAPQNGALLDMQGNLVVNTANNLLVVDTETLNLTDVQPTEKLDFSTYGIASGPDGSIYRPSNDNFMQKISLSSLTAPPTQSPTLSLKPPSNAPTSSPISPTATPSDAAHSSVPFILLVAQAVFTYLFSTH